MDNYNINNKMNVETFLKEIKRLKLTGREFLALIGNSKISNEAYKEIKGNPQLTYRRLVEILSSSPLESYDYVRLLRTAEERQRRKEAEKRLRSEQKLSEAVKAASVRIELNKEASPVRTEETTDAQTKGDYTLAYKPEFDDFYDEGEIDDDENPLFNKKADAIQPYAKVPETGEILFNLNSKVTRKKEAAFPARELSYIKSPAPAFKEYNEHKEPEFKPIRKDYLNERYRDKYDDYEKSDSDDNYNGYEDGYEDEEYTDKRKNYNYERINTYKGYTEADDEDDNKGKIIFCLILGLLLIAFSFGLRYYQTGSFLLGEEKTAIIQAPENYSELARLIYGLDVSPKEDENNKTENNYYINTSANNFKRDKICNNDKYIFTVINDELYCVEPGVSGGNVKQSGYIKKDGLSITEIFIFEQRLYMVCEGEYDSEYYSGNPISAEKQYGLSEKGEIIPPEPVSGSYTQPYTLIYVYDAENFSGNTMTEIELDGQYDGSLIQGNEVCFFTDYYVKNADAHDDLRAFIPSFSLNGQKDFIGMENIYIPPAELKSSNMKAFCTLNKNSDFKTGAVLGGTKTNVYSGNGSLFFVSLNEDKTNVLKLNNETTLYAEIDGKVIPGAIDERNGMIRICAETDNHSRIYIFNDFFELLSVIDSVAEGEKLEAVLFDDKFIYLITELLYVFDTSVPDDPITASGNTVNIYNDNYLRWSDWERFSFTAEADSNGKRAGLRLKMYSLEKGEYTEKAALLINTESFNAGSLNEYIKSPAEQDINSIYLDPESGLILLPIIYFDGISEIERYVSISYNETEGFSITGSLVYYDLNKKIHRALRLGNYVYTFWDRTVVSARAVSMSDIKSMELTTYADM